MMEAALEVHLGGVEGGIGAHTYAAVLRQLTYALEEIDRVIEPASAAHPLWKVTNTDWRRGIGAVVQLTPELRNAASRSTLDLMRTSRELWGGVMSLSREPEIPTSFTASVVDRVLKVQRQIKPTTGLTSVTVAPAGVEAPAEFSEALGVNARNATAEASLAYGSLVGRLDLISARSTRRRVGLRTDYGSPVTCDVEAIDQDLYMRFFAQRVVISGTLKRNARGQVVSLLADTLEPDDDVERISARSLLGAMPDITDGVSAVEYIRLQRGDA